MKKIYFILIATLFLTTLNAKEEEQHDHTGSNNIKINYETLNFSHSKKKKTGKRFGVEIDHEDAEHHYQFYHERTDTDTTRLMPKDLKVNKYVFKYQYKLDQKKRLSFSYATIDDNLMKETNHGNIFGIGYSNNGLGFTQYLSDYPHFDVYQTDVKYSFKSKLDEVGFKTTMLGKFIHLKNKNSNRFSEKADNNYFTVGVKLHTHYEGYHLGAGVYLGKRIFAVMKEGFKVQHHAMEFSKSFMMGIGHAIGDHAVAHLRYGYHEAKEVPTNNDGVTVNNVSLDFVYKF